MTPRRPALRYFGGKWRLASWIISSFPEHRIYVEPYGGGASVLLRKPESYAEIYNDIDDEVVNVFRVLRDHGPRIRDALTNTPFARTEFILAYEASADPIEQARRTIIKSFMGFGANSITEQSGFRANSNRSGTTPAHDWRNYVDCLDGLTQRFRRVVIESRDALDVMRQHDTPRTLFYVDPPYVHSTRQAKRYRHEMDDTAHERLISFLHSLKGSVVLSGYASPLYEKLIPNWQRIDKAALADGALKRTESLWIKPPADQPNLFSYHHPDHADLAAAIVARP